MLSEALCCRWCAVEYGSGVEYRTLYSTGHKGHAVPSQRMYGCYVGLLLCAGAGARAGERRCAGRTCALAVLAIERDGHRWPPRVCVLLWPLARQIVECHTPPIDRWELRLGAVLPREDLVLLAVWRIEDVHVLARHVASGEPSGHQAGGYGERGERAEEAPRDATPPQCGPAGVASARHRIGPRTASNPFGSSV